jgi:hypothetical protein
VQDVLDAGHGALSDREVGQVAFDELHTGDVCEVVALAGHETVDDADLFAATDELFREMGSDEAGAAGHEVMGHTGGHLSKNIAVMSG